MVVWTEGPAGTPASGIEALYDPTPGPSANILRVKAGDRLAVPVNFSSAGSPYALASDSWRAHVRVRPGSEKVCEFQVDATNKATGQLILRMEPQFSALLRNGMRCDVEDTSIGFTWFSLQLEVWGDYSHA